MCGRCETTNAERALLLCSARPIVYSPNREGAAGVAAAAAAGTAWATGICSTETELMGVSSATAGVWLLDSVERTTRLRLVVAAARRDTALAEAERMETAIIDVWSVAV